MTRHLENGEFCQILTVLKFDEGRKNCLHNI